MNRVTYISITKTGSTSIRKYISRNFGSKFCQIGLVHGKRNYKAHEGARFIDFHMHHEEKEDFKRLLEDVPSVMKNITFTTIRHPLDRIHSGYVYCRQQKYHGRTTLKRISFKKFIMEREKYISRISTTGFNHTLLRQTDFPIQNCDLYIRQENFDEGWKKACKLIGIPYTKLEVKNKTDHVHYSEMWDDEMIQSIYPYLKPDFDFLGYTL